MILRFKLPSYSASVLSICPAVTLLAECVNYSGHWSALCEDESGDSMILRVQLDQPDCFWLKLKLDEANKPEKAIIVDFAAYIGFTKSTGDAIRVKGNKTVRGMITKEARWRSVKSEIQGKLEVSYKGIYQKIADSDYEIVFTFGEKPSDPLTLMVDDYKKPFTCTLHRSYF